MLSNLGNGLSKWPLGTLVNMLTVSMGSLIGIALQQIFPADIQSIVFQAVGLGTVLIGIKMALRLPEGYMLIFIFSLIVGGITGQLLRVDLLFNEWSESLKVMLGNAETGFTEGLITAFLLFCIGSMTIVGALEEGISGKRELLLVKSTLDGFTSIALASTYGWGVFFSIIPMFLFQGSITMLAGRLRQVFSAEIIDALSATGGILIIGISVNLLNLGKVTLENLLPSLVVVVILSKMIKKRK
jgi:uncharacterized membrane protein YqgA involved in biofilm formation